MAKLKTLAEAQEHFKATADKEVTKTVTATEIELKDDGDDKGSVRAVFSVFNEIDTDGDVVLSTAFTDGQKTRMTWGHDWNRPIGKGHVVVQEDRAIFDGKFFLNTIDGEQAYLNVKNMEDLQEWSWGFRILDYEIEEDENSYWGYKMIIKQAELFEVSPVLIGANRNTRTLAVKSAEGVVEDITLVEKEVDNNSNVEGEDRYVVVIKTTNGEETYPISNSLATGILKVVNQEASADTSNDSSSDVSDNLESEVLKEMARHELMRAESLV